MSTVTIAQICDAIETKLSSATGLVGSQTYSELTEGVHDLPMLQVYWESTETDITTPTDRTTFKAAVRQTEMLFHADLYAQQRAHIGEDMTKLVNMMDAIQGVFELQRTKPYFDLDGIQAFHWRAERVTFTMGDPNLRYVGARFYVTIRVF